MKILPKKRQIFINGNTFFVTPNEFDALFYLCVHKETAVAKRELFAYIWNEAEDIDDNHILDLLMKRLRKKLLNSEAAFRIFTVWGYGFRMTEQEAQ